MYDTIILTLDGSALAEKAIEHAVSLAKTYGSRLVLLRAVAPIVQPVEFGYGITSPAVYQEIVDAEMGAARDYVDRQVEAIKGKGVTVEGIVEMGEPAGLILDVAEARHAGLIVMATHGRSGVGRWVFGSIADRVLHLAPVPVLLVRAGQAVEAEQKAKAATNV